MLGQHNHNLYPTSDLATEKQRLAYLDMRIKKRLKAMTDGLLESLWNFCDRDSVAMERNINQLIDFNGQRLQQELDALPKLSKLLVERGLDPLSFLAVFLECMTLHRCTRLGVYVTSGTLDAAAVVDELFEQAVNHIRIQHNISQQDPKYLTFLQDSSSVLMQATTCSGASRSVHEYPTHMQRRSKSRKQTQHKGRPDNSYTTNTVKSVKSEPSSVSDIVSNAGATQQKHRHRHHDKHRHHDNQRHRDKRRHRDKQDEEDHVSNHDNHDNHDQDNQDNQDKHGITKQQIEMLMQANPYKESKHGGSDKSEATSRHSNSPNSPSSAEKKPIESESLIASNPGSAPTHVTRPAFDTLKVTHVTDDLHHNQSTDSTDSRLMPWSSH